MATTRSFVILWTQYITAQILTFRTNVYTNDTILMYVIPTNHIAAFVGDHALNIPVLANQLTSYIVVTRYVPVKRDRCNYTKST